MTDSAARIAQVTALVRELARADVSGDSVAELLAGQDAAAQLGRLASALVARYAGEVARRSTPDQRGGGLARQQGFRDSRDMVRKVTGVSGMGARQLIEAGGALAPAVGAGTDESAPRSADVAGRPHKYPQLAAAVIDGRLAVESAAHVSRGLTALAERLTADDLRRLEATLTARAVDLDPARVRRMVDRAIESVEAADARTVQEKEARQHRARSVTWRDEYDGMVTITARLDPLSAAPVKNVIEQMVTHAFRGRRDQDPTEQDTRTVGQMRADALVTLARHALDCDGTRSSGVTTTMVVRISADDLRSGTGLGEIDGMTQRVSVRSLRDMARDAEVLPAVLDGDSEVLDWGRARRLFTKAQRLALVERDGGCARCHAPPEHCEAHHIRWWDRHRGSTDLSNGVLLCVGCHHSVHRDGWDIAVRDGRVWFTAPPDTRGERAVQLGGRAAIELSEEDLRAALRDFHAWDTQDVGRLASRRHVVEAAESRRERPRTRHTRPHGAAPERENVRPRVRRPADTAHRADMDEWVPSWAVPVELSVPG